MIDWPDSTRQILQQRYPRLSAPEQLYSALCLALSGRSDMVDWAVWSPDRWHDMKVMAVQEGVAPLLYWTWNRQGYPAAAPPALPLHLKTLFLQAYLRQQMFLGGVNERILPALAPFISPLVLLKGAALAQTIYPHPALRLMGDLDILVRPQQIQEAIRRCRSQGYDLPTPSVGPNFQRMLEFHSHLSGAQHPTDIEIHHSLVTAPHHPYAPRLEWFWSHIEPLPPVNHTFPGPGVSWLAPTAQLLHLAAHMVLQHGEAYMTLIKYYDVYILLEQMGERIEWDDLTRQVDVLGWDEVLDVALQAVMLRFQTHQAGQMVSEKSSPPKSAAGLVMEQRLRTTALIPMGHLGIGIGALPWPDRWMAAWEQIVPTPAYMRWRYQLRPAWLWPLAYLVRWFNGLRDTVRLIGMRFERDRSP